MNAKAIAQEIVDWYRDHRENSESHAVNVKTHLYGPVLSVTRSILLEEAEEDEFPAAADQQPKKKNSLLWEEQAGEAIQKKLYDSLHRRSQARFDAFLAGVSLAMPEGEPVKKKHHHHHHHHGQTKKSDDNNTQQNTVPPKEAPESSSAKPNPQDPPQTLKKDTTKTMVAQNGKSPVLTSLNHHGKALLRSVDPAIKPRTQPQIRDPELLVRLELYLRSLYRVNALGQDCVVAAEPPRAVQARGEMIIVAFVSTVGCVRSMSPSLTKLLSCLTRELLAVEYLGHELVRVIRRLVNEYEHGTSFASLAFLSSPEASAETRLRPMIMKYIRYLQSDWRSLERECELERMLTLSLDSQMRLYFKTAEFQSIGHLLEACHGYRNELNNIELTPLAKLSNNDGTDSLCNNTDAVRQAVRDLQREVITINGHVLPPVTSRKALIDLLSQSLNSRTLTTAPPEKIATGQDEELDEEDDLSLGDDDGEGNAKNSSNNRDGKQLQPKSKLTRRASFHLSTVDILTRRLLIAAGRTGTGGDAYFIVRDLFGDEDVEVVPSKILPHHVRASRVGSIEIQVRLASVTIKCHGSFDVYPKSLAGLCEPLIQLHTTTSETIYLQEKRSGDSSSEDGGGVREDDGSSADGTDNLVLKERTTQKTGWRMLSIRPALYEKVQVWNTPS